jgi:hypothetical protein
MSDEGIDALWNYLQNDAPPEEREMWERAVDVFRRGRRPWWRLLGVFGMYPHARPRRVPSTPTRVSSSATEWVPDEGVFAARDDEISPAIVDDGPYRHFPTVEIKQMDPVKMATLGAILGAGTYDELVSQMIESGRDGAGDCGVFRIPPEVRDGLAGMTGRDEVATRWAATEELDRWTNEETTAFLTELAVLASRAVRDDRQLWVWWEL